MEAVLVIRLEPPGWYAGDSITTIVDCLPIPCRRYKWADKDEQNLTLKQESILDKISAEIEQNAYPIVHGVNNHELGMTLHGILQVIDKYKAESEG